MEVKAERMEGHRDRRAKRLEGHKNTQVGGWKSGKVEG